MPGSQIVGRGQKHMEEGTASVWRPLFGAGTMACPQSHVTRPHLTSGESGTCSLSGQLRVQP